MRIATLVAVFVVWVGASVHARAQRNPYDREVRQLVSEVRRSGNTPRGIVPLLDLTGYGQYASPGVVRTQLGRLARERRLSPMMRVAASVEEAFALLDAGEYEASASRFRELGFLTDFRIAGGFDDEGRQGFTRAYPPEAEQAGPVRADAVYEGKLREVRWRTYPAELGRYGFVDFDATTRPYENACAYAETFVNLDRARPMTLSVGAAGAYRLWVNGEEISQDDVYRLASIDRQTAVFQGREGHNRVLMKVCVQSRRWGFYLRLGEADGSPARNFTVDANGATQASAPASSYPALPEAPEGPLAYLRGRVEANADDAAAHYDLARYLVWSGSEETTDRQSRALAERAAELRPTVDHLLFASDQVETRAERIALVTQAEERFVRDPEVRLARVRLVLSGPDSGRALRMLEAFPMTNTAGLEAAWLRASMLEERELREAAFAIGEAGVRITGGSVRWRSRLASMYRLQGRVESSWREKAEVLALIPSDNRLRFDFMTDAYERGAMDEVFAHLDQLNALDPSDPQVIQFAASLYEGLGRHDDALDELRKLIAYAPDEAEYHLNLGRALLRFGQQGAAIDVFREVLALRPQDAATRQLIERLRPAEREDEGWAAETETLLARRVQESEWHATTLHDLQVVTVFDTGLASTFHQVAFQVHDDEGARSMRSFPIPYEPGRQWVEVRLAKVHRADGTVVDVTRTFEQRLGDSRYRIYYDTRALVVQMPQLYPGDMVELRYRVEDVSRRNMFNDYYGDVRFLQGAQPTGHLEHVLITPASREFFFNEPNLQGLRHEREVRGEQRVDRFVAADIPALRSEPNMPGPAAVRPYLHVSTYRSWEDVGRWWWGLVREQLVPDASLIATTQELVAGARDDREKVTRIYDWVIRNTRYVGLEFGIHGFKPYRVTQIVRRGFGDCKDKASLIYTMLTIAGIDARIALIRTRRNGTINTTPASLAVFDHAIAYVPQFDLFLDGTAEMNGTRELPAMDQGTMTLLVGPESATLRNTPVMPASAAVTTRTMDVTLAADGSAEVNGQTTVTGDSASRYRSAYQAESTQEERMQRELSGTFPGVELSQLSFENLDAYEEAPSFRWTGQVPRFAEQNGSRLLIAPASIGNLTRALAPSPRRRHPIDLGAPGRHVETRRIRLPRGATLEALPEGGEVRSEFGRLSIQYRREGQAVVAHTEWELTAHEVAVDDYPAFRRFAEEQDVLLRQRITLVAPQGGAQ